MNIYSLLMDCQIDGEADHILKLEFDFTSELINLVEEIIKSKKSDETCVETLKMHFIWKEIWCHPKVDLVFFFIKVYPQTFIFDLPKTREWLTEGCFKHLDSISCEVIKQIFGLS